jgi:hypothetical protein
VALKIFTALALTIVGLAPDFGEMLFYSFQMEALTIGIVTYIEPYIPGGIRTHDLLFGRRTR